MSIGAYLLTVVAYSLVIWKLGSRHSRQVEREHLRKFPSDVYKEIEETDPYYD